MELCICPYVHCPLCRGIISRSTKDVYNTYYKIKVMMKTAFHNNNTRKAPGALRLAMIKNPFIFMQY